jgi:hypothetical protein
MFPLIMFESELCVHPKRVHTTHVYPDYVTVAHSDVKRQGIDWENLVWVNCVKDFGTIPISSS